MRPHSSGFDIALGNEQGYGGILIRGILVREEPVYGPLRSANAILASCGKLWGEAGLQVKLVPKQNPTTFKIYSTKLVGLGKNAGEHADLDYRFIACNPAYLKCITGKETIYKQAVERKLLTKEEAVKAMGYKPKGW